MYAQWCPTLYDPMERSPQGFSVHGDSPGKNSGVGCRVLLQGIFPVQGLNPGILHHRRILYHLSHQGSPRVKGQFLPYYVGSSLKAEIQGRSLFQKWNNTHWGGAGAQCLVPQEPEHSSEEGGLHCRVKNTLCSVG